MKTRFLVWILLIGLGAISFFSVMGRRADSAKQYQKGLEKARSYAAKDVPYTALQNYQKALAVRCDDEAVMLEYLEQAEKLGDSFLSSAIREYIAHFPASPNAYERKCLFEYAHKNYGSVLSTANTARELGIATEKVRELYLEVAYMIREKHSGLLEAQSFLGSFARVKTADGFGYIGDSSGYVIPPQYEAATALMNNAAVYDGKDWVILNQLGYTVARPDGNPDSLSFPSNGWILISKDGKWGYTTTELTMPEKLPFDKACNFKNQVAAVCKDGKWALINSNLEKITDFIFDDILLDEYDTCVSNGVIFVKKDGRYYLAGTNGEKLSDKGFENARPMGTDGYAAVCEAGKWGFVDAQGIYLLPPQYEDARSFSLNLAAVKQDGAWSYISKTGEVRVAGPFEDCLPFSANGIAAVKKDGLWEYIQLYAYIY